MTAFAVRRHLNRAGLAVHPQGRANACEVLRIVCEKAQHANFCEPELLETRDITSRGFASRC